MNVIAICLAWLLSLNFGLVTASAHNANCDVILRSTPALTLRQIKERSVERANKIYREVPAPTFDNLEEQAKIEQVGEKGPQAFQELLPFGVSFVQTPAPAGTDPLAVDLLEEGRSLAVHVDVPWDGRRTSTAAFVSLPLPRVNSPSKFLVGPEYPVVLVHLHGGGTPTATGRNAMSIAREIGKRGIPVVGIDLPGHGRATRNPEGLETFKKQADWLMKAVKQLVDPKVKIVLSGHSWGGSFALFMHRLSQDPNYSRISQYISLSPPVDVSLGGSLKEKLEFEQNYAQDFERFKDRIAPADFEFQSNLLNNGKDSDIGAYFTNLTDLDYRMPPMTDEEQGRLKKITVIVGDADGLVYVGREEPFQKALGGLKAPSQLIVLGQGTTWKSKSIQDLLPTGHNIFDRYVDGTTTLQTYQLIGDAVLEGGANLPTNESTGSPNLDLIDRAFRHYANFFGFREMLQGRIEYVITDTEHRQAISKRKGLLEEYLRRVQVAEDELEKMADGRQPIPSVQQAVEALRSRLGITENINVRRAEEDLATPPLTPERKALLEKFIAEIREADRLMRESYVDLQYDEDLAQLNKEYQPLLTELGMPDVTGYKAKLDEFSAGKKELSGDRARIRGALSRLHQRMIDLNRRRESRFGVARDARLSAIDSPPNVRDQRSALRELNLDHSPERRAKLQAFVAEHDKIEAEAKQKAIEELKARIDAQPRPPGVSGPEEARLQKAEQESFLDFTFVPPGQPEIAAMARQIRDLTAEVDELEMGDGSTQSLDKMEASVKQLRVKRAGMLKTWDHLWKTGGLSSPAVVKSERGVQATLANYKALYFAYENKKSDYLLELKESGRLTAANILALTPEIKSLRRKVQHAKQVYFKLRSELDTLRWVEGVAGRLDGPPEIVKKATVLATEIWGHDFARTRVAAPNSLTQQLRVEEGIVTSRQEQMAERELELNELRYRYVRAMSALNQRLPFQVHRVDLGRLFHQPLAQVVNEFNTKPTTATALAQMLAQWESYLAKMRTDSQSKDGVGY